MHLADAQDEGRYRSAKPGAVSRRKREYRTRDAIFENRLTEGNMPSVRQITFYGKDGIEKSIFPEDVSGPGRSVVTSYWFAGQGGLMLRITTERTLESLTHPLPLSLSLSSSCRYASQVAQGCRHSD
ncbi:hypothetical protein ACVMIH_007474 [Bradyrhizobium sp. USDA 4503]